jgi:purine-binding chemotaxis protein CheW
MDNVIKPEDEQDTQKGKYLTFYVGDEVYALEISQVREIISILPITTLPEYPAYIKGVVNLRGQVIPVMDMRLRLKKEPVEYDSNTCIVIIEVNNLIIGLIVDNVSEVTFIEDSNVMNAPEFDGRSDNRYIKSIGLIGETVWLILDCRMLLSKDEVEVLSRD